MPNGEQSEPVALPLAEAAARLGLSTDALRMRIKRGKARGYKKGRNVFVYMDEAEAAPGSTEQRPNRPAASGRSKAPAAGEAASGPWAVLAESQKQEVARLVGDVERLNQRLDRQLEEARELRQMLQREQVLRQQEQTLRQELQDMLERLVERPALTGPAAESEPGEGSRIVMRAATPGGVKPAEPGPASGPAPSAAPAPEFTPEPAPELVPPYVRQPEPSPAQDERPPEVAPHTEAAPSPEAPPPASDVAPGAEGLADMLKEIGQSLRDIEDHAAETESDLEGERRAAARVMSRLFRSRTVPRPPES
jgi:DNA-binding Lrp family transcriptional regulator